MLSGCVSRSHGAEPGSVNERMDRGSFWVYASLTNPKASELTRIL